MRTKIAIIAASTVFTACGGGDDQTTVTQTDYSRLRSTPQNTQALRLADTDKVKQHLANGLRLQLSGENTGYLRSEAIPVAVPDAAAVDGGATSDPGFSDTNVHVAGVDEADLAKYDGSHWFIANPPHYNASIEGENLASIDIVATDPSGPSADVVASLPLDEQWGSVGEMYLVQQNQSTSHVAYIRNQWGNVMPFLPGVPFDLQLVEDGDAVVTSRIAANSLFWQPQNAKVQIQLVDVTAPSMPINDWRLELDGSLIDSRKIGNTLYLITRFDPWLPELTYEWGDTSLRDQNEAVLASAELEQLMPHYYIEGNKTLLANDCYLQEDTADHYGYRHLVNITAVDLASKQVIGNTCLNSSVEAMSMSPSNLYLTGTVYEGEGSPQTVIHKFALTEQGAEYRVSGSVAGTLGWTSDPAFRMHEHQQQLRIVTTESVDGPLHRLTILADTGGALTALATLPNETRPAPIGKPGENIYAVRFEGDSAYIVTFRRTDPLYAIDLSDPLNPLIAGELEIPGYATYMHPLPNNHLFTLGYDADETGVTRGIKAELIRVSDGNPEVLNTFIFGGAQSSSEALHNLRALSVLSVGGDQVRFAFPVSIYARESYYEWQYTGLQMMQVEGLESELPLLSDAGTIIAEEASPTLPYPQHYGTSRAVLHDDAVFFTYSGTVWSSFWAAPEQAVPTTN